MVGFIIGVFFGVMFSGGLLAYFTYKTDEELKIGFYDELEEDYHDDYYNDRKNS